MYKTWEPADSWATLCGSVPACAPYQDTCHRNMTCLGGSDTFFNSNLMRGNFYYRTEFFRDDSLSRKLKSLERDFLRHFY